MTGKEPKRKCMSGPRADEVEVADDGPRFRTWREVVVFVATPGGGSEEKEEGGDHHCRDDGGLHFEWLRKGS